MCMLFYFFNPKKDCYCKLLKDNSILLQFQLENCLRLFNNIIYFHIMSIIIGLFEYSCIITDYIPYNKTDRERKGS